LTGRIPSTSVDGVPATDAPTAPRPEDGLASVVALRRLADRVEDAEVERAIRGGWSWAQVAEALGVTKQAVPKKHAKRLRRDGVRAVH
jgi:hypothetical protein